MILHLVNSRWWLSTGNPQFPNILARVVDKLGVRCGFGLEYSNLEYYHTGLLQSAVSLERPTGVGGRCPGSHTFEDGL